MARKTYRKKPKTRKTIKRGGVGSNEQRIKLAATNTSIKRVDDIVEKIRHIEDPKAKNIASTLERIMGNLKKNQELFASRLDKKVAVEPVKRIKSKKPRLTRFVHRSSPEQENKPDNIVSPVPLYDVGTAEHPDPSYDIGAAENLDPVYDVGTDTGPDYYMGDTRSPDYIELRASSGSPQYAELPPINVAAPAEKSTKKAPALSIKPGSWGFCALQILASEPKNENELSKLMRSRFPERMTGKTPDNTLNYILQELVKEGYAKRIEYKKGKGSRKAFKYFV